jgi:porphobilinogen synthase
MAAVGWRPVPGHPPETSNRQGPTAGFPVERPRRLRRNPALRRLVAETRLSVDDLVAPLFVADGLTEPMPIGSMPGVVQHTVDSLTVEAKRLVGLGLPALILFGVPRLEDKDATGSSALRPDGIVQRALRSVRDAIGDTMVVIADCCLDEFTDHGHCGVLDATTGEVDNDATLPLYAELAVAQATSGADVIAPSGMMDGQVGAIRGALDSAGSEDTAILAYAAKYASSLYGPFREAVDVEIVAGGDRLGYQQDPRNRREARREVALDVGEGADMVMVKPAITYLDVIADVRAEFHLPVGAYHVSGEYSMVKAAAERGWIDGHRVAVEQLTAVKRAGADFVLTYFAAELAEELGG